MHDDDEKSRSSSIVETVRPHQDLADLAKAPAQAPTAGFNPSIRLTSPLTIPSTASLSSKSGRHRCGRAKRATTPPAPNLSKHGSGTVLLQSSVPKTRCMRPRLRATLSLWNVCTVSSRPEFCNSSQFICMLHFALCRVAVCCPACPRRIDVVCLQSPN